MNFFTQLKPLKNFLEFNQTEFYQQAPSDWWIVITDVQGSTKAIEQGRYKEVNMVGASTIAALSNVMDGELFPFVFGGDGATALVPESKKEIVEKALRTSQAIAREQFDLHLRIGLVSVQNLIEKGHETLICRYELPGGPSLAFFKGEGLEVAEKIVKSGHGLLSKGPMIPSEEALAGLSCRWSPLKSERHEMLSLLVKATLAGESAGILRQVAEKIHLIVDLNSPESHPIKNETLAGAPLLGASSLELKTQGIPRSWFSEKRRKIIYQMLAARLLLWTGWKPKGFDMQAYQESLPSHSDFRKFDALLRMVIDISAEMTLKLRTYLEEKKSQGLLFYGMHSSKAALMTCFVKTTDPGKHIHFVDGSDGGYAIAAKELKKQMQDAVPSEQIATN